MRKVGAKTGLEHHVFEIQRGKEEFLEPGVGCKLMAVRVGLLGGGRSQDERWGEGSGGNH